MIRAAVAASLAALALAGCSGTAEPVAQPSPKPAAPTYSMKEQFFLSQVGIIPHYKHLSNTRLLQKGHRVCSDLDHGAGIVDLVFKNMTNGAQPVHAGWLIGFSVYSLCPAHRSDMHKWTTEVHDSDYLRWKKQR